MGRSFMTPLPSLLAKGRPRGAPKTDAQPLCDPLTAASYPQTAVGHCPTAVRDRPSAVCQRQGTAQLLFVATRWFASWSQRNATKWCMSITWQRKRPSRGSQVVRAREGPLRALQAHDHRRSNGGALHTPPHSSTHPSTPLHTPPHPSTPTPHPSTPLHTPPHPSTPLHTPPHPSPPPTPLHTPHTSCA